MPKFVRFFIKTGLAFFVISLLLGVVFATSPFIDLPGIINSMMPTYLHIFMVGWITQIIFGVSIWMFPSPDKGGRYGNETIIWFIYWTLNVGILLRVFAEPGNQAFPKSGFMNFSLLLSALLQWSGALLYAYHIWGRIKGK